VEINDDPNADAPQHVGNTADGRKEKSKYNHRNPMIIIQPYIKGIFDQIWRVFRHQRSIAMLALSDEKPADVSPPGALAG
jgi:hypothetical protein